MDTEEIVTPVSDTVLEEGSYTNEDRLTVLDGAAWVIDGTSGFSDRSVTDHPESDGVWFVETAEAYLRDHIHDDEPLEEILRKTIEHLVAELQDEIPTDTEISFDPPKVISAVSMEELPGATIALVRWDEDTLEYYSLGDSSVIVNAEDEFAHYNEGGPQQHDEVLRGHIQKYISENPNADLDEIRESALPHIRESRKYREVPGGFWCLGINPASAKQAVRGSYPVDSVSEVFLFTDGLLDIVELFEVFQTWEDAAVHMREQGVEKTLEQLRNVQREDDDLSEYPRLKQMDDAAIVYLDFEAQRMK